MGLLDQLAGQVLGSVMGGQQSSSGGNALLQMAGALLQGQGGLAGVLQKFQAAGLGEQATSWVGTGDNMAIDGSQITQALGQGTINDLAAKFGLSGDQVSDGLAQVLPQLIDKMTPHGNAAGGDALLQSGLSALGSLFNRA